MEEKNTSLVIYNSPIRKFFNDIVKKIKQVLFKDPNGATFSHGAIFSPKVLDAIRAEYTNDIATIDFNEEIAKAPEQEVIKTEEIQPKEKGIPKTPEKQSTNLLKIKRSIEKKNEVDIRDENN